MGEADYREIRLESGRPAPVHSAINLRARYQPVVNSRDGLAVCSRSAHSRLRTLVVASQDQCPKRSKNGPLAAAMCGSQRRSGMVERLREFLRTGGGRATAIALATIALIAAVLSARSNLGDSEAAAASQDRWFVCSETGKAFRVAVKPGMTQPIDSPYSGKKTGYQAALCYWTAAGGLKNDPTPVLMNESVGKKGPTFCPDCGRLVSPQNPPPMPGVKPPPTKAEYKPVPAAQEQ
jgi:hypothetical protein